MLGLRFGCLDDLSLVRPFRKISVLVPVFNEVRFIRALLDKLEAVDFCGLEREIIIVDDGSTDGTLAILRELEATGRYKVVYHQSNRGKGAALRTAIEHATGDLIAIQDADLEYNPADYPPLIEVILRGEADVVYGSRFHGNTRRETFQWTHYLGNKLLTFVTNLLYGTGLTDMETCYKVFRADVIKPIPIRSDRFDFEPEITAKVLKAGHRLKELPISYNGRNFHEGKKITWRDGLAAIQTLIKYRFVD